MNNPVLALSDKRERTALLLWILITLFCAIQSIITYRYNNYLIFENTFRNLTNQQSLYALYPAIHGDSNHYGPVFGLFIMPFALLPNGLGLILWDLFNCLILFIAIRSIALTKDPLIYFIAIPCLVSSMLSEQFNPTVAAFIILSFTLLNKNKGLWSALLIVLGTLIKLYGIVGLGFFFFVKNKKWFISYLVLWTLVLFVLPMMLSSPDFIISSYKEWMLSLSHKNESNFSAPTLDVSIMGFIRRIFSFQHIPNTVFLIPGLLIYALPYINFKAFGIRKFQLNILASTLLFPVLFSSGSEDCTYIIAITGVSIWYVLSKRQPWQKILLGITVLFSCDFPLLFFPKLIDQYPALISMISVPFFVIWILIIYESIRLKPTADTSISAG